MRLQKFLAHAGICSRRKAETFILEGRVRVNDVKIDTLGTQVDPEKDQVMFDNKRVSPPKASEEYTYIAVNKPRGVITSCSQKNARIILDLVPIKKGFTPLAAWTRILWGLSCSPMTVSSITGFPTPSHNHEKEYLVKTLSPFPDTALKAMADGMVIEGVKTRKAKVVRISKNKFKIILKQGRNRQIRKMVEHAHNKVDTLKRIRMANINLGDLKESGWRYLTAREIKVLTQ